MKVLVVSDLHLTARYDQRKFEFLKKLFKKADKIILNGDFWSYHSCTFDEFVNSRWRFLFPILKKRKTVYIHGNHDLKKWSDQKTKQFCIKEVDKYEFKWRNKKYKIEHGNLAIGPIPTEREWLLKFFRFIRFDDLISQPIKVLFPRIDIFRLIWFFSLKQRRIRKKINRGDVAVVLGHTHCPSYAPGKNYINSGYINFGLAHYLWITNGEPRLVSTGY